MTQDAPAGLDPGRDFPLASHRPELLRTPTGKRLEELTLDAVLSGEVSAEDVRITPATLRLQAEIADAVSRPQLAENMRRASELTAVPDARILEIYNGVRAPRRRSSCSRSPTSSRATTRPRTRRSCARRRTSTSGATASPGERGVDEGPRRAALRGRPWSEGAELTWQRLTT
jgi:hypothetical protein